LRTLGTPFLIEFHSLAFFEAAKSITGNGTEMDEYISAFILLDKPITLPFVKPLYSSFHLAFTFPVRVSWDSFLDGAFPERRENTMEICSSVSNLLSTAFLK
jgi:hypothetical protein